MGVRPLTGEVSYFAGVVEELEVEAGTVIINTPAFVLDEITHDVLLGSVWMNQARFSIQYDGTGGFKGSVTDEAGQNTSTFYGQLLRYGPLN
jgi:alkyl sulfatase BDS1-like metallo-beta-lactamase superfamily hydrolase